MKRLYLLRHAKSAWNTPAAQDHDRPLNPRGKRAAPLIGRCMRAHGHVPQIILCSSARRARDTLELVVRELGRDIPVTIERDLYLAPAHGLLARLRGLEDTYDAALLIGHNPGLEDLVALLRDSRLSPQAAPGKFPTAALAVFELDAVAWRDLAPGTGRLLHIMQPRELAG